MSSSDSDDELVQAQLNARQMERHTTSKEMEDTKKLARMEMRENRKTTKSKARRMWVIIAGLLWWVFGAVAVHFMVHTEVDFFQSMVTSFYIVVQIITTIGYGDITVEDRPDFQLFVVFYIMVSIVLISWAMNVVSQMIFEREQELLKKSMAILAEKGADNKIMGQLRGWDQSMTTSALLFVGSILLGTFYYGTVEDCTCSFGLTRDDLIAAGDMTPNCTASTWMSSKGGLTYDQCVENGGFTKSYINAFYMSVVTITTVGFGDYSPRSIWGRLLGSVWMVCGVACTANFVGNLSEVLFKQAQDPERYESFDAFDTDSFRAVARSWKEEATKKNRDISGALPDDAYMDYGEYLEFVLQRHGVVDAETFAQIRSKFELMDLGDDGKVTWGEITRGKKMVMEHQATGLIDDDDESD